MFCKKCGTEFNDNARFCPRCGYDRMEEIHTGQRGTIENNRLRFQIKPTFNFPYKICTILGRAFLYVFFICWVFTSLWKLWSIYPVTLLITVVVILIYVF